jgi:hypothetical protein
LCSAWLATCLAGLVADIGGPVLGGLFLAFPAIFLASATLIEAHERRRKRERGLHGNRRGRQAAALDAAGATFGSAGLFAFAIVVWLSATALPFWTVMILALLAWSVIATAAWRRVFRLTEGALIILAQSGKPTLDLRRLWRYRFQEPLSAPHGPVEARAKPRQQPLQMRILWFDKRSQPFRHG